MLLIPAVLIVGGILALVLYLEKTSPPYQPFDALQDEFYRSFASANLRTSPKLDSDLSPADRRP
jgi:hypothetical protein